MMRIFFILFCLSHSIMAESVLEEFDQNSLCHVRDDLAYTYEENWRLCSSMTELEDSYIIWQQGHLTFTDTMVEPLILHYSQAQLQSIEIMLYREGIIIDQMVHEFPLSHGDEYSFPLFIKEPGNYIITIRTASWSLPSQLPTLSIESRWQSIVTRNSKWVRVVGFVVFVHLLIACILGLFRRNLLSVLTLVLIFVNPSYTLYLWILSLWHLIHLYQYSISYRSVIIQLISLGLFGFLLNSSYYSWIYLTTMVLYFWSILALSSRFEYYKCIPGHTPKSSHL